MPKPTATQRFVASRVRKKPTPATKSTGTYYYNGAGKLVQDKTGRIKPEQLYYLQPGGSYELNGDRRTPGCLKPPAKAKQRNKSSSSKKRK